MDNKQQIKRLGVGAMFPIILQQNQDTEGNKLTTLVTEIDEEGNKVQVSKPSMGWFPLKGNLDLVKQSITSILTFQLGQRFRQEYFGVLTWAALEEPNIQMLHYKLQNMIRSAILQYEPRVTSLNITTDFKEGSLNIGIRFWVGLWSGEQTLEYQYTNN